MDDIARLRELLAAGTHGEWVAIRPGMSREDIALACAAVTALPALLDRLEAAEEQADGYLSDLNALRDREAFLEGAFRALRRWANNQRRLGSNRRVVELKAKLEAGKARVAELEGALVGFVGAGVLRTEFEWTCSRCGHSLGRKSDLSEFKTSVRCGSCLEHATFSDRDVEVHFRAALRGEEE
jgi:hypothetical protein